ncbi:MAG: HAD-IA family hydrolase [Alphaproteobacteria bacterium]|nr:HAD-IA family hydrolase [Alphaproteobacteria bacterium]
MANIELVIFDFDGVIVDSEHLSSAVLAETLQQVGVPLRQDDIVNQFTGLDFASMMSQLVVDYGQEKIELFADKIENNYTQKMRTELQLIPHILAFLQTTKLAFCIASNSKMSRLLNNQQNTNIADIFSGKTYSADMVKHPKPAPDLFLYAAQQMGFAPEVCLVIEDGAHGIKAANDAGMPSIGFTGGSHCKDGHAQRLTNAGALHVFDNMSELTNIINNL